MAIFYSYEYECEVDHLYDHAYHFGDRQMEDIWFKVSLKNSAIPKTVSELEPSDFEVEWPSKYDHYTQTLNMDYWTKEALKYCPRIDIGNVSLDYEDGEVGMFDSLEQAHKICNG